MRTGRNRSRTITRHVRAVFELNEGSHTSQHSLAMNEANYTKLQNQYFQPEPDSSGSRDSGLGEMVSGDDQSLASSDVPTPGDSDRSFVISPTTSSFPHSKKKQPYSDLRMPSSLKPAPISRNKLINQAVEDSRAYLVLSSEEVHRIKSVI